MNVSNTTKSLVWAICTALVTAVVVLACVYYLVVVVALGSWLNPGGSWWISLTIALVAWLPIY